MKQMQRAFVHPDCLLGTSFFTTVAKPYPRLDFNYSKHCI